MKKNIVIIILLVIVLGLGGYLVYDKVIDKDEKNIDNEIKEEKQDRKNYEVVGHAFSGIETYKWPTDTIGKEATDPNNVVNKIEIPKILIETDVTKKINTEIYEKFEGYIEGIKSNEDEPSRFEQSITYDYNIKDDILFIRIESSVGSVRSSGRTEYYNYYYNIKEDKELTIEEVLEIFNISMNGLDIEGIVSIEAIMPGMANTFNIYYNYKTEECSWDYCSDEKRIGYSYQE